MISTRTTFGLGVIFCVAGLISIFKGIGGHEAEVVMIGFVLVLLGFLLMGIEITRKE